MEGLYGSSSTVLSRTTHIFNKEDFSDVLLIVGESQVQFHGHKLLLSLASPIFAHTFEGMSTAGEIITLSIPDVDPEVFYKVLKYMYTDEMKLNTVGEARRILLIATKYQILPLSSICKAYIVGRYISPQTVIKMYETAVNANVQMGEVKELCMYTFSEETKAVFRSDSFVKASQSTIEAIIKLDKLSVDNELDILNAVVEWGEARCRANDLPMDTNLRVIVESFFKHIRILTIPLPNLKAFWKKYTNLMTSEEVCAITVALLQPAMGMEIPRTLCSLVNPRNVPNYCQEENMEPDSSTKDNPILNTSFLPEETLVKELNTNPIPHVDESVTSKEISTNIKKEPSSPVSFASSPKSVPIENSNNCLEHISTTETFHETKSYVSNELQILSEKNSERRVTSTSLLASASNVPPLSQTNNTDLKVLAEKNSERRVTSTSLLASASNVPPLSQTNNTDLKVLAEKNSKRRVTSTSLLASASNVPPLSQTNNTDLKVLAEKNSERRVTSTSLLASASNVPPLSQTNNTDLKVLAEKNSERRVTNVSLLALNVPTLSQTNNILKELTKKTLSVMELSYNDAEVPIGIRNVVSPQNKESESESENESGASDSEAETVQKCIGIEIELDDSKEIPKGLRTADVTSVITFTLTRGYIKLIGVKVQLKKVPYLSNEQFTVFTRLEVANRKYEQVETMNDSSSPFDVVLKKPVHVCVSDEVKIFVTVQEIQLQRCLLHTVSNFAGYDERNNTFNIQISSNQGIDKVGVPFLISEVLYNYGE